MVVAAESVPRHVGASRIVEHRARRERIVRQIIHSCAHDAQRTRHQFRRPAAFGSMPRHVPHLAVTSCGEPGIQQCGIAIEIDARDTDLLKAQLPTPVLYRERERCEIRLSRWRS